MHINNTRHAVMTDTHLVFVQITGEQKKVHRVSLQNAPCHVGDICTLANQQNITHIWLAPGSHLSRSADQLLSSTPDEWDTFFSNSEQDGSGFPMFGRVWLKGASDKEGRTVKIGFPEHGRWEWDEEKNALNLLGAIHYLQSELQIPVEWSAGHMATEQVKMLNRRAKRQEWTREATIDLKSLPFNKSARDLIWKTERLAGLETGLYLHQFDKNSSYLAACTGVQVGAGDPVHVTDTTEMDCNLPGIYRVTFNVASSIFDGQTLPLIITTDWITHNVLQTARKYGYEVAIHEAYQFPEKHRTLETWANALWTVRTRLKSQSEDYPNERARALAYGVVKDVALIGVGKFASKKTSQFLRPDWWASIVGRARATMFYMLSELHKKSYMPVLIYNDSIYIVSPDPIPETAGPDFYTRAGKLGGYKHEGTLLITDEVVEAFHKLSPGKLVEWLNDRVDASEEEE